MDKKEQCLMCEDLGEYWDWHNGILISLCRKHVKVEVSS